MCILVYLSGYGECNKTLIGYGECSKTLMDGKTITKYQIGIDNVITEGNTDTLTNEIFFKSENDLFTYGATYMYKEDENVKKDESLDLYCEYEHKIKDKLYFTLGSKFEYDYDTDLEHRISIDPGVRYYPINTSTMELSIGSGLSYAIEKYDNMNLKENVYLNVNQRFKIDLNNRVSVKEEFNIYPMIDNLKTYRADLAIGTDIVIVQNLKAQIKTIFDYNSDPMYNHEKLDTVLKTGILYEF
jgi:putative salt-induced outer membrane protein YdiY